MDKTTYRIIVRPLPDDTDPQGWRRIRAWLKAGLRSYRLQCVDIGKATLEEVCSSLLQTADTEGGAE